MDLKETRDWLQSQSEEVQKQEEAMEVPLQELAGQIRTLTQQKQELSERRFHLQAAIANIQHILDDEISPDSAEYQALNPVDPFA